MWASLLYSWSTIVGTLRSPSSKRTEKSSLMSPPVIPALGDQSRRLMSPRPTWATGDCILEQQNQTTTITNSDGEVKLAGKKDIGVGQRTQ